MNAMLQQFFNIPQFRYSLLDANDEVPPNIGTNEVDDNVIHQLQRMFGFLELTERQAYNPAAFCYSFKDFSGAPTNISIQQDAQEFLNMIIEKIENALKNTKYKYLMQGVFGGKTVSQCICKVCGTTKENLEDFYNLSLDVKHSKTLAESLQKFITGDTISDYMCEKCDKRVDITKRNLIESVPNILIIHLQRIVFNFDTFANEKINSRLEFPTDVDLYPYTKLGLENTEPDTTEFQYELTGIVVHKGTAEMGHYYSFIKTEPNKWFEFNDSTVKSFK
jgi:Ubiquitin carboxyl-terminal hydrolase